MDEAYAQSLIDWMDTDCGNGMSYRDWFDQQGGSTSSVKGAHTDGGPSVPPPPPPKQ